METVVRTISILFGPHSKDFDFEFPAGVTAKDLPSYDFTEVIIQAIKWHIKNSQGSTVEFPIVAKLRLKDEAKENDCIFFVPPYLADAGYHRLASQLTEASHAFCQKYPLEGMVIKSLQLQTRINI